MTRKLVKSCPSNAVDKKIMLIPNQGEQQVDEVDGARNVRYIATVMGNYNFLVYITPQINTIL